MRNARNSASAGSPTAGPIAKPAASKVLAITHERGLGQLGRLASMAWRSSGRNERKARICSLRPVAWPYRRKSSRSGSIAKWRNRLASGAGISNTLARSCLRLPAAQTNHPSGNT